ncbi:MAG: DUF2088 domain-containing protein [Candidatus Omnitrophica bacterium]|nr:DUF2088 domain-containing protein [Candidatus Omnitrophota bacterium]
MYKGKENREKPFTEEELKDICGESLTAIKDFSGKKVLVIIPDTTRSGPTDLLFRYIHETLSPNAKSVDFLIALGTHPIMSEDKIDSFLNINKKDRETKYKNSSIFQHHWDKPEEIAYIGTISASKIREISNGLLSEEIPVTINSKVFEYDEVILAGPVFPHEVVGFSGGYKYLFPGISGPDFLHKFHWLGALITNPKINGTKDTPVRRALNEAAKLLKIPLTIVCYVVQKGGVYGFYAGDEEAWSKAADLSSQLNIKYVDGPFKTVLSIAPEMYEDIWTAGKCMYKLEPVVADGGTLIIYAPHVKEVSHTHGHEIEKVGYHTRDYFLKQKECFENVSGCILAHSTHVKGIGTFDGGTERPRVTVVLATGIPEETCRKINLGYLDYRTIDIEEYKKRKDTLVVEKAGEVLYRLKDGKIPDIDKL